MSMQALKDEFDVLIKQHRSEVEAIQYNHAKEKDRQKKSVQDKVNNIALPTFKIRSVYTKEICDWVNS